VERVATAMTSISRSLCSLFPSHYLLLHLSIT
jgi:hypothetical protein